MILAVDDNVIILELLGRICADRHWELDIALDGLTALRKVQNNLYSFVLMDLNLMGDICGVETAILIRMLPSPNCNVPIVALTGLTAIKHAERWDEARFDGSLVKPFTVKEFETLVEKCVV